VVDEDHGDTRVAGSDDLVAEIAVLFDLDEIHTWEDLGGSRTTNLRLVCDGRQIVARVHRSSTSVERLAAEQAVRTLLARAGVPTVIPLADGEGRTWKALGNGDLVEAEAFVWSTSRMNSAARLLRGFCELARIHDALRHAKLPPAARHVSQANYISAGDATAATRQGVERIQNWRNPQLTRFANEALHLIERVTAAERRLRQAQVIQVVHGDFWDNNVLFDKDLIAAVLDFGFMNERPRIDDLALPFWFYLLQHGQSHPTTADQKLLRSLVDAYDEATTLPLTAAELEALPLAIARQPAWSFGGWVLSLREPEAIRHAHTAAAELPIAQAVIQNLRQWHHTLTENRS
jgi:Ser/Thr protein kinase RdoA (MazF antagonist)